MWKPKTTIDWFEIIGTIMCIIAAILLASHIGLEGVSYILFFLGSLLFCFVFLSLKRKYLLLLNFLYVIINLWGIWRWLLSPWLL